MRSTWTWKTRNKSFSQMRKMRRRRLPPSLHEVKTRFFINEKIPGSESGGRLESGSELDRDARTIQHGSGTAVRGRCHDGRAGSKVFDPGSRRGVRNKTICRRFAQMNTDRKNKDGKTKDRKTQIEKLDTIAPQA